MRHCQVFQPAGITLQIPSLTTPSTCDCVPKGLEHFNSTKFLSHFISALENFYVKGPQDFLSCQLCVGLTGHSHGGHYVCDVPTWPFCKLVSETNSLFLVLQEFLSYLVEMQSQE